MSTGKTTSRLISKALMAFSAACWASKHRSSRYTSWICAFARARLLRARFSHSRGSSGENRSGDIDHFTFPKRWGNYQSVAVAIPFDVLGRDHNDVNGLTGPMHVHVNLSR